jgi:hypothetical protein
MLRARMSAPPGYRQSQAIDTIGLRQPAAAPSTAEHVAGAAGGRTLPEAAAQTRTAAVIRTAQLALVAKDFPAARAAVDALILRVGGFADHLAVSEDMGTAHTLRGVLRVPGDRLNEALTQLRALGHVMNDQQQAQDVADQLVDLDARLSSSRATEQRLIDLMQNRTGRLSDVLEVEREITRVRLDIERLAAEKQSLGRRVSYATIDLTIAEERKAGLEPGPLPLMTQLRIAAADGLQSAVDTVVATTLLGLRAGPSLLIWGCAASAVWLFVRRVRAGTPRASE